MGGCTDIICEICKSKTFLAQKAEPATANNLSIAQDPLDNLTVYMDGSFILAKGGALSLCSPTAFLCEKGTPLLVISVYSFGS